MVKGKIEVSSRGKFVMRWEDRRSMSKGRALSGEEFDRMLAAVDTCRPKQAIHWKRLLRGLWFGGLRIWGRQNPGPGWRYGTVWLQGPGWHCAGWRFGTVCRWGRQVSPHCAAGHPKCLGDLSFAYALGV